MMMMMMMMMDYEDDDDDDDDEEEEEEEEEEICHIPCLYVVINFKLCASNEGKVANYEVLLLSPVSQCFSDEERVLNKKGKSELSRIEKKAVKGWPIWDIVYFFSVFEKRIVSDSVCRCTRKSVGSDSCLSVNRGF